MKKIWFILMGICLFCSCQDDTGFGVSESADGKTDILLQLADAPVIETRADGDQTDDRDNRVENVVIFVFDAEGNLINTPTSQAAEKTDNSSFGNPCYKIREYLPSNKHSIYAVCNYDKSAELIEAVKEATKALDELKAHVLTINSLAETFKGAYVMEGYTETVSATVTVPVYRVVSKQEFTITFDPEDDTDQFCISNVAILNVPKKSKLIKDEYNHQTNSLGNWTGDAVYSTDGVAMAGNYIDSTVVEVETLSDNQYKLTLNLFENRRGGKSALDIEQKLGIADRSEEEKEKIRQLYKKDLAEGKGEFNGETGFPYASCLVIEGVYQTSKVSYHAMYYVYLGHNNFGDFNVVRNHQYQYHVTIKTCDMADTRVWADGIGDVEFFASDAPLSSYFCVREALLYSPGTWEVYVENPDETPWLEISESPSYKPHKLGETLDDNCAQYRLTGGQGSHYIYLHADEYVPPITDPSQNSNYGERTATICYKRQNSNEVKKFTVTQKPAQLVRITAWDFNLAKKVEHSFFVEAVPGNEYLSWGFEKHWSMTMDNLISTGLYDGLSTSRKEYVMALWGDKRSGTYNDLPEFPAPLALEGAQEAAYRGPGADMTLVPLDIALGATLFKNRDRNGNGLIDYNEILWYLPAAEQLEGIYEAITDGTVELELNGETFWSSTPSVSDKGGITPGRAYYVKMSNGKRGIGLRDQQFRVLCCRDAEGWMGPEDGNGSGQVNNNTEWENKEENMPK